MAAFPAETRVCAGCGFTAHSSEWDTFNRRRDGRVYVSYYTRCPPCRKAQYDPAATKNRVLRRKYGITLADYERMASDQAHRCAICREQANLVVDHCHATGAVRGLLCDLCNRGIGMFRDNRDFMQSAISYLED